MKRRIVLLTDAELRYLQRELLDLELSTSSQPNETRMARALMKKLARPGEVTKRQWDTYKDAAGEMFENHAEVDQLIGRGGMKRCEEFSAAVDAAFNEGR